MNGNTAGPAPPHQKLVSLGARGLVCLMLLSGVVSASAAQPQSAAGGTGTAFAVGAEGALLTNAHVVFGCSEVAVTVPGEADLIGRIAARDSKNDLALIYVGQPLTAIATFRRSPIRAGEDVIALGFPLSGILADDLNVSKGIVSATAGIRNDTAKLQVSAAVQPGNSGGPLLDTDGNVAGVIVSKLDALVFASVSGDIPQNVNFAIKGETASAFLRTYGLEPQFAAETAVRLRTADAVEAARSYTFLVECDPARSQPK